MREFILRTRNYFLILLLIYLAYSAIKYFAGSSAPECTNKQSIETVYQIFKEKILPKEGLEQQAISNIKMKLFNIVTLDKNSNTGAYFCQGDLDITLNDKKMTYTIEYNNRLIEDSKNQFLTSITSYK